MQGYNSILPREISEFCVLLMVVENSHRCSIGLTGYWDDQGIWFTSCSCSSIHSVTTRALWMEALPSYRGHCHASQNNGLPSSFIHDPKHDGMLFASLTQEPHLWGSTCFQYTLCPSFTQVSMTCRWYCIDVLLCCIGLNRSSGHFQGESHHKVGSLSLNPLYNSKKHHGGGYYFIQVETKSLLIYVYRHYIKNKQ